MSALGRSADGQNFLQSWLWSVVGQGLTLEAWIDLIRKDGKDMNADKSRRPSQHARDVGDAVRHGWTSES